jgi:hypothetical protein
MLLNEAETEITGETAALVASVNATLSAATGAVSTLFTNCFLLYCLGAGRHVILLWWND